MHLVAAAAAAVAAAGEGRDVPERENILGVIRKCCSFFF